MSNKTHLCMVIESMTGEVLSECEISSSEYFFARHKAKLKFEEAQKYQPKLRKFQDWYIDSCEID